MGRLARHRKTKNIAEFDAFDARSSTEFEFPPSAKSKDAVPRSLRRLMRRQDYMKKPYGNSSTDAADKINTSWRRGPDGEELKTKSLIQAGETPKQALERLENEHRTATISEARKDLKIVAKRKAYFAMKKEKDRNKRTTREPSPDFAANDNVRFGEVAEAPPSISSLPRKAMKIAAAREQAATAAVATEDDAEKRKQLLLLQQQQKKKDRSGLLLNKMMFGAGQTDVRHDESDVDTSGALGRKRKEMTMAQKVRHDEQRENVIAAYRKAKQQRMN